MVCNGFTLFGVAAHDNIASFEGTILQDGLWSLWQKVPINDRHERELYQATSDPFFVDKLRRWYPP